MSSAHVIRVKRLYRQGLKCLHNWTVHRDLYISKGFELRAEFDAQKLVTNPSVVEKLVSDGEAKLVTYAHPSPYTRALAPAHRTHAPHPLRESPRAPLSPCPAPVPTMPGGTKYQRHPNNNLGWSPEVRNSQVFFRTAPHPVPGSPARPAASPLAPLRLPLWPAQLWAP